MAYTEKPKTSEQMFSDEKATAVLQALKDQGLGDHKTFIAKTNGTYKGKVAYEDKNLIGQLIGKDGKTLILHQKNDLALADGVAKSQKEKGLKDSSLQIYYGEKEDKAKTYFYSQAKEEEQIKQRIEAKSERVAVESTVKDLNSIAMSYAQKNIKDPAEIGKFIAHFGNVVETFQQQRTPQQQQQQKTQQPEQQAKEQTQAQTQTKAKATPTKEAKQQQQGDMER